jgi:hypothetical protein
MYEIAHQKVEDLVYAYEPAVPKKVRAAIKDFFRAKYADPRVADL